MNKADRNTTQMTPGVERWQHPAWMAILNKVLNKIRSPFSLVPRFDHRRDMMSLEQISNFEFLISDLLERKVEGAFVELGCYTGSTTVVFAELLSRLDPDRPLHAFDRFDIELSSLKGIRAVFEERFRSYGLALPVIHEGDLFDLVPSELPAPIAFAHIDLGTGGGPENHKKLMDHAFAEVYPRLSKGAVLVMMDYYVPGATVLGHDSNPGVRLAADAFFADKPEKPRLLFGGPCAHAYVRKV